MFGGKRHSGSATRKYTYTISDLSRAFGVHKKTITRWEVEGRLARNDLFSIMEYYFKVKLGNYWKDKHLGQA